MVPRHVRLSLALVCALQLVGSEARAVLDIENGGPTLTTRNLVARVTNAGIIGNAFFDVGRSFDPSLESPAYSGKECLNYGALWVGGRLPNGTVRVSGAPNLEWRPTLDREDRVRLIARGDLGALRMIDDDGDRRIDEEWLDGKDDDGDGRIDEDLGLEADELASASYSDSELAAVASIYPNGETHTPMQLSVRQTAIAWRSAGLDNVVGLCFAVTSRGAEPIRDVYLGFYADLDSRLRSDRAGHLNDQVQREATSLSFGETQSVVTVNGIADPPRPCFSQIRADYFVAHDGARLSELPAIAVIPLDHTVDPLASIVPTRAYATAPRATSFRSTVLLPPGIVTQGRVPLIDEERYEALRGAGSGAPEDLTGDYSVLVSCGPFQFPRAGTTIEFTLALVVGPNADNINATVARLLTTYHGYMANLLPDSLPRSQRNQWLSGETGTYGHEVCIEPPPGVRFQFDPHCGGGEAEPQPVVYEHGTCIWTNADCDGCTGVAGKETRVHWLDPGSVPVGPDQRVTAGDHAVDIAWDNLPEVLAESGQLGPFVKRLVGYRIYKLADWRRREGALAPRPNWALVAAFSDTPGDTLNGEIPLNTVTDSSLDYLEVLYEQKHYPVGRYHFRDAEVHNGFDYAFRVTAIVELELPQPGGLRVTRLEGPLVATIKDIVVPHAAARDRAGGVWVVPNPYRAHADWDRPPVAGDPLSRHIDFMGLPRARCTIKIWTVAGDFVAQVDHDGSGGDGQASWNLVSRNGQDTESGIYLYTVDSPLGQAIGRFVVIR